MAPNTTTFVRDYTSLGKAREATASEADSTKLFDVLLTVRFSKSARTLSTPYQRLWCLTIKQPTTTC